MQRLVEGQHLDQRLFLHGYDVPVEGQRHRIHSRRQAVLEGRIPCNSDLERLITLRTIDDLWADYLACVDEVVVPALRRYSPELILVSLGFAYLIGAPCLHMRPARYSSGGLPPAAPGRARRPVGMTQPSSARTLRRNN